MYNRQCICKERLTIDVSTVKLSSVSEEPLHELRHRSIVVMSKNYRLRAWRPPKVRRSLESASHPTPILAKRRRRTYRILSEVSCEVKED